MPRDLFLFAVLCCLLATPAVSAQITKQSDEVIRVNTELVQSDVLVLDKKGQFVDGLKASDFQLRVNGKPRAVLFSDRLTAGSASEEGQIAAARGQASSTPGPSMVSIPVDRGRTIIFYLDDYHLSPVSLTYVKQMLMRFVEEQMGPNDEIAIITATGQLGFLEQLTGEKVVLQRAIAKIGHRSFQTTDAERPPMSEVEALAIVNEDRRIIDYFVEQLLKDLGQPRPRQPSPAMRSRDQYENLVRGRAKAIVHQISALNTATLSGFERFLRASSQLPWQKLLFFISDGFVMVDNESANAQLHRITDAATRSGATVYTVDARGLVSGTTEAARKMPSDYTGRLASMGTRSITVSQLPLRTIAIDSGGQPILDTNDPQPELKRAVLESSNYYQLAWRPEEQETRDRKFQVVEVSIPGKPELTVRVRQGFFFEQSEKANTSSEKNRAKDEKKERAANDDPLQTALRNNFPWRGLPVSVSAGFMDIGEPNLLVTASVEVAKEALDLKNAGDSLQLDLIGVAVDESGKPVAQFSRDLTVQPSQILSSEVSRIVYNEQLRLAPGLYQIRVAVRERKLERIGTATQWLEIPDSKLRTFALSSLFLGEIDSNATESGKLSINGSHRFRSSARMGFMTYVYNAAADGKAPDLSLQIQILRDGQPVLTQPSIKVDTSFLTDLTRIPYGEELQLKELPKGKYVLQVNVVDRVAKKSAQQQTRFVVQ